jgi:hypothetical protein
MDGTSLILSFVFGMIGMGMVMYAKKAGRVVPLGAGVALMALPYFISNSIAMVSVCAILMATPWLVRQS